MSKNNAELRPGAGAAAAQEKRSEWKFGTAERGLWRWRVRHPDGTEVSSHRGYPTLRDCIADATQHGYQVWLPEAERRKIDC